MKHILKVGMILERDGMRRRIESFDGMSGVYWSRPGTKVRSRQKREYFEYWAEKAVEVTNKPHLDAFLAALPKVETVFTEAEQLELAPKVLRSLGFPEIAQLLE